MSDDSIFIRFLAFLRNEHIIIKPFLLVPSEMILQFLQWLNDQGVLNMTKLNPIFRPIDVSRLPDLIAVHIETIRKFLPDLVIALLMHPLTLLPEFYCDDVRVCARKGWLLCRWGTALRGSFVSYEFGYSRSQFASWECVIRAGEERSCRHWFFHDYFFVSDYGLYGEEFELCRSFLLFALFILLTFRHLYNYTLFYCFP